MNEHADASDQGPLLSVSGLKVAFAAHPSARRAATEAPHQIIAVDDISLSVARGEALAIVGESGSGKSQAVMAVMGLLAKNGSASGAVEFDGRNLLELSSSELDRIRGRRIGMIFQEPMTSLDPLYRIAHQMALPLRHHMGCSKAEAREKSIEMLRRVGIADAASKIDAYPHELSGGQRQRVMIAMALSTTPDILIADEPTTALDVTVARRILELIDDLKRQMNLAVILISHDLNVVRRYADRVAVMARGKIVETARVDDLFAAPRSHETRRLIDAEPRDSKRPILADAPVVLSARDVTVDYPGNTTFFRRRSLPTRALDAVTLDVREGETLGVVGESGSGKSSLGRALLKLVPAAGAICFEDRALAPLSRADMRPLRRNLQIVFQDPYGALSPRLTVGEIVAEGLRVHEPHRTPTDRREAVATILAQVGLDPSVMTRFPHEFSGGQRQRIAIARAMILKPKLLVLDEPTSALDRTIQREILDLLRRLQEDHRLTYIFISHDLAVVRAMADRIIVMQSGRIVEQGPAADVTGHPTEPYTRELMAAAFGHRITS